MWFLPGPAAAAPSFSVERGAFEVPFELDLSPGEGGEVWARTAPGAAMAPWAGPVTVADTTVVQAQELRPDGSWSPVATHTYVAVPRVGDTSVMDPRITQDPALRATLDDSLRNLPLVSVVTAGGLSLTEAPGSVEWLDPVGDDSQVDCGVHIVGGASWAYPKTSVRLNFRSRYGAARWDFDVYGDDGAPVRATDSFDALSLRGGNHDSVFYLQGRGQYLRNRWADETQLAMGHVMPHGRFVHVFVDGTYHGVYHVRERFSAGFLGAYHGGDEADYEVVTGGVVEDGTGLAWAAIVADAGSYEALNRRVVIPQYLDYLMLQYYAANAWDWYSTHNWMGGGPAVPGRGGWIFHGNDQDITLYYDAATTDITALGGPGDLFPALWAERHPDLVVAVADAVHRNFEGDGPVTADRAAARYEALAAELEDALVGESARWGGGWWDRDEEWVAERDWLLGTWFPQRTATFLAQARARGWYPVDAAVLDVPAGVVAAGTEVRALVPAGATVFATTDGSDPRLPGGAVAPAAAESAGPFVVEHGLVVSVRSRFGDTWGPLERRFYEVDAPPAVVVNEWSGVAPDEVLAGGDAALGVVPGNGGPWVELVVLADGLDLRGWRLTTEDRWGRLGEVRLSDDPAWAALPRGTLFTVAADLPEDAAFDPAGGDWRFHARVGGALASGTLALAPLDARLTVWDAQGRVRFGPVGEGIEPRSGLGDDEVGAWKGALGPQVRRDGEAYGAASASTFGAANTWDGGSQDLEALRARAPGDPPPGVDPTAPPAATGPVAASPRAAGCGCASTGPGALPALWLALAFVRRRPALWVLAGCGPEPAPPSAPRDDSAAPAPACFVDEDGDGWGGAPGPCDGGVAVGGDCDDHTAWVNPGVPEACDGVDEDCSGAVDDDPVDGLPFFEDADGDGFGVAVVTGCALGPGWSLAGGDCDDGDGAAFPGAPEACDAVDQDCDGSTDDALGASAACAAASCADVDGAGVTWVTLPGGPGAVWCDSGWMLGFLRNTASTGDQPGFGGPGGLAAATLAVDPAAASASTTPILGWHDLNALAWTELEVAAYRSGAPSVRSRPIPRADLRIPFGADGYLLYGESGYYWCGGAAAYTDSGLGAVNNPVGAPPDCKGHGLLGSGWDFSESPGANAGLTLCGMDGSQWLSGTWGGDLVPYGAAGGAHALWVR